MGIAAVGALIGGTAVAAGAAIETVALVATVVTVVGAVTGNSTLMKLGAGGGLGSSIASWAGLGSTAAADAAAAGSADAAAGAASDAAAGSASTSADGLYSEAAAPSTSAFGPVNNFGQTIGDVGSTVTPDLSAYPSLSTAPSGLVSTASAIPDPSAAVQAATATPDMTAQVNAATGTQPLAPVSTAVPTPNPNYIPPPTAGTSITDWFKGLDKATQGKVASAAAQGGMTLLGGLSSAWTASQKLDLEKAQFALSQQQYGTAMKNANSPATINYTNPSGLVSTAKPTVTVVAPVTNPITGGA